MTPACAGRRLGMFYAASVIGPDVRMWPELPGVRMGARTDLIK